MKSSRNVPVWLETAFGAIAAGLQTAGLARRTPRRSPFLVLAGAFGLGCAAGVALALGPSGMKRLYGKIASLAAPRDDGDVEGVFPIDVAAMDGDARREAGIAVEPFMEEALAEAWADGR